MHTHDEENQHQTTLTVAGWAAATGALAMLAGVILQMASGWFPDAVLASGDMAAWHTAMAAAQPLAMIGVLLMLVALVCYMVFGLHLATLLGRDRALPTIGLAGYLVGIPTAFVAFALGFAATWALVPLHADAGSGLQPALEAVTNMILRIFLVGDDLATLLIIGLGNGSFAIALDRAGWIPRWHAWFGIAAGAVWLLYLFHYLYAPLAFAVAAAPLSVVWILLTGIFLLRKAAAASTPQPTLAQSEPAGL